MAEYEHRVQYYETDQMGIVHHSNYIRWFEEARTFRLEEAGFGYKKMEECGVIIPVLSVNAEYRSMVHFYDCVVVESRVTAYNGIKLSLAYRVLDKESGELRCTGESSHCFLDRAGKLLSLKRSFPEIHEMFLSLLDAGKAEKAADSKI